MQSDWYKTRRLGTYLVVPAGADPSGVEMPEEIRALLESPVPEPYCANASSREVALSFDFLGVEDCLRTSGYCILRS